MILSLIRNNFRPFRREFFERIDLCLFWNYTTTITIKQVLNSENEKSIFGKGDFHHEENV